MSVPPRWLNCPRKSQVIANKFIAFKTPLSSRYDHHIPLECRFDWAMLVASMKSLKVELGMVIDLTNTTRFYDKKEVESLGISYVKLQCRGFGATPSKEQTETFIKICKSFWERYPEKIIGVHCTHGFNRSGFLIISYFVQEEDWSVEDGIEVFVKCRPPGIYKQDYLKELCQRYGSLDTIAAPDLPDWCFEEEDASDNEDSQRLNKKRAYDEDGSDNEDSQRGSEKRRKKRRGMNEAKFMDGVDGIEIVKSPHLEKVQEIVQKMCGWAKDGFPGSQPVSMGRENIQNLNKMSYRVTWKADGVRYMFLILKEKEIYLIDRDNNVFAAPQMTFPQRKNMREHVFDTLIDGEMVLDKENDKLYPRYLAYDIIKFQGQDVGRATHDIRMVCIQKEIIGPRNEAARQGLLDKTKEPFGIRDKTFFPLEKSEWILDKWIPKLSHENDGLILNPNHEEYMPGQSPNVLKWKPHEMNSVDFLLNISTLRQAGCLPEKIGALMVGGYKPMFSKIKVTKELRQYDKKIIECTWNGKEWIFLRVREDKSFPNAYETAMNVCKSISHPVKKEDLLEYIEKYKFRKHGEGSSSTRVNHSTS